MKKKQFVFLLFLTFSAWLSLENYMTDYWSDSNDFQEYQDGVINHTIYGPLAYRVMIPYVIDGIHHVLPAMKEKHVDLFLNIFLILLIQLTFYCYLEHFFSASESLFGTMWLNLAIMMSLKSFLSVHVYETTDLCNILFMILAMQLLFNQKWRLLAVVLFFSMLNRETPAFLLIPVCLAAFKNKSLVKSALLCSIAVILPYAGLKLLIHPPQPTWFVTTYIQENIPFYRQGYLPDVLISYMKLIILLGMASVLAFMNFKNKNKFLKSFAIILPFYFIIHVVVAHVEEYRIWVPLFLFLIPLAMESLHTALLTSGKGQPDDVSSSRDFGF